MRHLDFWHNPLVVSAFRVKHRRGGLFLALALYVSFLGSACMIAWFAIPNMRNPVLASLTDAQKLYWIFVGLHIFQMVVSAFFCMVMTASAMTMEVNDGTLEYQRLTKLSPKQILLGKLLGAPALVYMVTFASIPYTFGIWSLGVTEISFFTLLLLYVNLATTMLLSGALGLINPLRKKEQGQMAQSGVGIAVGLGGVYSLILQFAVMGLPAFLSGRGPAALTSLFLPLGALAGMATGGDPWLHNVHFFEMKIPFLLATPVAQVVLLALIFVHMDRRLTSVVNTPLGKPTAYGVLAAFDILFAAVLFDSAPAQPELAYVTLRFWFGHVLMATFLIFCVTPPRELLMSWIWRWRGQRSLAHDLWLRDRTENILVLVTSCGIGLLTWSLLVAAPLFLVEDRDAIKADDRNVCHMVVLTCVLTLSLGTMYQSCLAVFGTVGASLLLTIGIFDVSALIAPLYVPAPWLKDFSIIAHVITWRSSAEPELSLWPLLFFYLALFVAFRLLLRRALRIATAQVNGKLTAMGVGRA